MLNNNGYMKLAKFMKQSKNITLSQALKRVQKNKRGSSSVLTLSAFESINNRSQSCFFDVNDLQSIEGV